MATPPPVSDGAESWNSCKALWKFLKKRRDAPRGNFTFYVFLIFAVVGGGGVGIWVALIQAISTGHWEMRTIVSSLYTYFPAVAMASAFELILPDSSQKYVRSFALASISILTVLAIVTAIMPPGPMSLCFAISGVGLAIAFWWIANAENKTLYDPPPEDAPLGGSPTREAGGDISGFAH